MVQTGTKHVPSFIETSKLSELDCLNFNKEFVFYQFFFQINSLNKKTKI